MEPSFSRAWFETFGRRDDAETAREVDFLLGVLPSPPASVLDVPCGFGRHARALAERGYAVTGIEREPAVAAEARAGGVEVHELDMRRLDELPGTFDAVICLWASFGWWDDDTNAEVLRAMAAKTRTTLVLDVYDPAFFRAHQGPRENRSVRERRRMDGDRLRTTLEYRDGTRDEFEWRLYEPEELAALGTAGGLRLDVLCAGYDPQAPPAGDVPRMQAVFARDN